MGVKLSQISDGSIEVIARIDDSLEYNEDDYQEYLKTLDESKLKFVEGKSPTKFIMRKVLPYKLAQKVQNKQMRLEKGEAQFSLSFMAEEVRCSLTGVKNPDYLPDDEKIKFEKSRDDDGASDGLIEKLIACGIASDLYVARQTFMHGNKGADLKKS
jgi:hypothetical protein